MTEPTGTAVGSASPTSIPRLIGGLVRRPTRTLGEVAGDSAGWRRGLALMVLVASAYTVVDLMLAVHEVEPIPEPFLRIPTEEYYWWALPFYGASFLAGWLLATAGMQLAGRAAGGEGEFEGLAAATGLATAVATLPTLIPDLITSTLGVYESWATSGLWRMVPWLYVAVYVVLFLILYPLAVAVVHKVSRRRAILIGTAGFIVYQGFLFLFVR